jgi:hypothetical protein
MIDCIGSVPHEWAKWEQKWVPFVDYVDGWFGKRAVSGKVHIQMRICNKCNKTEKSGFGAEIRKARKRG